MRANGAGSSTPERDAGGLALSADTADGTVAADRSGAAAGADGAARGAFIAIEHLTKRFGTTTALDDLDLEIPEGQFLVLLGPSGCGKTTTMRCVVGLERADTGRITVAGRVLFDAAQLIDVPPNKRDMGMVFQSYALWPHKDVFGNVAFPLQMKRRPRAEIRERVHETLGLVGLDGFAKRNVTTLSGGQMQRVALARSLVMDPTILLLDEPLSNLDAKLRVHLRHELKEIQQRVGVTTIYVTHDQDEALGLADRIVVMRHGVVAQDDTPPRLYRAPATPFVADFLGMGNQFAAVIEGDGGDGGDEGFVRVRLEGTDIRLLASDPSGLGGGPGVVCLRPDAAVVRPGHHRSAPAEDNELAARVLSRQYQGRRLRYHVRLEEGLDLFGEAEAGLIELDPGAACTLSLPAAQLLVLPPDDHVADPEGRPR
ncbi:MAG: ABC transporter ATP-binding protein [Acidimicrobiia bacterium]